MTLRGFAFPGEQDGAGLLSRQIKLLLTATFVAIASSLLPLDTVHVPLSSYVPVHTILECSSIVIAVLVFATVWFTPTRESSAAVVIISAGLAIAALLDFLHMMSIIGMPDFVTPSSSQKSISFWLTARGLATIGFLLGSCIPSTVSLSKSARWWVVLGFASCGASAAVTVLFYEAHIPVFFVTGTGTTPLKGIVESALVGLLALSAMRYFWLARASKETYYPLMFGAMAIASVGELFFSNYSVANDTQNLLGHIYKILSYWLIFQAMFILSVRKPYEQLAVQTAQLMQANEALQVQSMALESTATPVMVTDVNGMVTWRNRASIALEPILSKEEACLFERFLTPDPEQALQMQARLAAGDVWRGKVRYKNVQSLYLDRTVTPVRSETGALKGYVSVSENITLNVRAEARHRRVLESALDGYWVIDTEGRFLEVNKAYARMSGYSTVELLNMSLQDVEMMEDKADIEGHIRKVMQVGHDRFKTRHRKKDGSVLTAEISVTYDAELLNIYVFIRDLTDQERSAADKQDLERQLQHSQKIQALGQLTGGIAHDFNNILASILGYSNLAISRFAQDKDSKLAKYLREIVAASERARDLIAKMMAFTRTVPVGPIQVISPSKVVEDVVAMLRPSIPSSTQLTCGVKSDLAIRMDPGELNQVLVNLIINARDAISGQGRIDICVRQVRVDGPICAISRQRLVGDYLAIEVSDTGDGILPENLNSLFNPFFTTKEVGKGTGLGLSVVQGILHKCGGNIVVESQPGHGSLFQLLFPVATSVPTPNIAVDQPASARLGAGQAVWILDDEVAVGGFVEELLSESGYHVRLFNHPQSVLNAFKADPNSVQLLITDQTMPGLTGTQLVALMHAIRRDLPVIICTGFSDGIPANEMERHAIQKLFVKPVPSAQLLHSVAEILAVAPAHLQHG